MEEYRIHLTDRWRDIDGIKIATHTESSIVEKLNRPDNIPGFYSYIEEKDDMVTATVDHIRSIPVFYAITNETLYISDNIDWIAQQLPPATSSIAETEYELTGYVTGRNTRHPKIKQLLAGESLHWDDEDIRFTRHFDFEYNHTGLKAPSEVKAIASRAVKRLINYANGRQIVLLLSGGLDSRIIAALLVKHGYENLITVTYGRRESREATIAKQRADALNINWKLIEYNHAAWRKWYRSNARYNFFEWNDNLAAIPHIEMGPALRELKDVSWIDADAVITLGHSGDMVAGSHIPIDLYQSSSVKREEIVATLLDDHYSLDAIPDTAHEKLRKRLIDQLSLPTVVGSETACEAVEAWDVYNRQAKFIVNSVRTIEAAGFDWYLPLWDREFTEFWLTVPLDQRVNQTLYREAVASLWQSMTGDSRLDAIETERSLQRSWLMDRIKDPVKKSPVEPVARTCYEVLREIRSHLRKESPYSTHPLAWYGIVPEDIFNEIYTGSENINTFIAKERLGNISFEQ